MESCRRETDQLTDGQVVREWERMNTAWTQPPIVSKHTQEHDHEN